MSSFWPNAITVQGLWLRDDPKVNCIDCFIIIKKWSKEYGLVKIWIDAYNEKGNKERTIKVDYDFKIIDDGEITNTEEEVKAYPINEDVLKGFEEFTKIMFKQGQEAEVSELEKCLKKPHRFDSVSNNYITSEIKQFLIKWFDKKMDTSYIVDR